MFSQRRKKRGSNPNLTHFDVTHYTSRCPLEIQDVHDKAQLVYWVAPNVFGHLPSCLEKREFRPREDKHSSDILSIRFKHTRILCIFGLLKKYFKIFYTKANFQTLVFL